MQSRMVGKNLGEERSEWVGEGFCGGNGVGHGAPPSCQIPKINSEHLGMVGREQKEQLSVEP